MNQAKMQAAAQIIKDSAIEFLAAKHGLTVETVITELNNGNARAMQQFAQLVKAGIDGAIKMHNEGQISLV